MRLLCLLGGRTLEAVGLTTLCHLVNTGLSLGCEENILDTYDDLPPFSPSILSELLESHHHAPGILALRHEKIIAAVVGLILLLLRELGVDKSRAECRAAIR